MSALASPLLVYVACFAFIVVLIVNRALATGTACWGLVARRDLATGRCIPTAGGLGFLPGLGVSLGLAGVLGGDPCWLIALLVVVILGVLGLVDDRIDMNAGAKLVIEFLMCLPALLLCSRVHGGVPAWQLAVQLLFVLGAINVVNMSDNMDGAASGFVAITALGFAACGLLCGALELVFVASTVFAVCVGFLVRNFPPASVFMGDTGSGVLGGMLGFMAVDLFAHAGLPPVQGLFVVPGLLLGVLLLDGVQVVVARLKVRRPVFWGDRRHLTHRLEQLVGSKPVAVALLWIVQLLSVGLSVVVFRWPELTVLVTAFMLVGGLLLVAVLWRVPGAEYETSAPAQPEAREV